MDQYKIKIEADLEIEAFSAEDAADYVKDIIGTDQEVKSVNIKKITKIKFPFPSRKFNNQRT